MSDEDLEGEFVLGWPQKKRLKHIKAPMPTDP
jgi:hypothetical protein